MNDLLLTTLKVIAALAIGFTVNFSMTRLAAPGSSGMALAVAVFLTFFGFIFAKFVMEIVLLPIAVISLVRRWVSGKKPIAYPNTHKDRIDFFGRVLFVLVYGFGSAITGIFVGVKEGGMGWFTTSALFGTVGILLAMLIPANLVWSVEGSENVSSEPTVAGKADIEQARTDGNPSVLFADKLAKRVIDAIVEKPKSDNKH